MDALWSHIETAIGEASGQQQTIVERRDVGGGCINQAFALRTQRNHWFVKINAASLLSMFEAEAAALQELWDSKSIRVPKPLTVDHHDNHSFLVMEHLDLHHTVVPSRFGAAMALLHQPRADAPFGWHRDNTIGSTPQHNTQTHDWVDFFRQHRLGHQIQLAQKNAAPSRLVDSVHHLMGELDHFFSGHHVYPALLHGDLWSGNWGALADGTPVIFDPASYYGDHETDLAMMELFGNPGQAFFQSYAEARAIDPGYETRRVLYNLYHILNHFNLFGGGYASQAQSMTDSLLAEIR